MKKRKIIALFLATTMTLSTVACGGSDTTDSADATESTTEEEGSTAEKTTITVTYRDDGTTALADWLEASYETWDMKDEVEVEFAPITATESDYFAKVALSLQSEDTAPDLVCEDTFQLASDVAAGYLTDLSGYLADYEEWNDGTFSEALIEGLTYDDGSVYAVPYDTDTRGLWYNTEIFAEAGIETPWEPETWDDILEACALIQENCPDVIPIWFNSGVATGEATSMQTYEMFLYGTGEELLDEDDKWIISSDGITSTLEFIDTVYENGYGPSLSLVLNGDAGNTSAQDYFPNGKLAITLDGFWITGNYKEDGASPWEGYEDIIDVAAMPAMDGDGTVTMSGGWGFSVPELSDEKDLAVAFMEHCMDYDLYLEFIVARGNISTRTDIASDPLYAEQPFMEECTGFVDGAYYRPKDSLYTSVTTYIQTMVEAVASGTEPEDAIAQYGTDVTNTVGEDNVVSK